jgi:hypothetical protein
MTGRLSVGADLSSAVPLRTNLGLAFTGMYPLGQGFVIQTEDLTASPFTSCHSCLWPSGLCLSISSFPSG